MAEQPDEPGLASYAFILFCSCSSQGQIAQIFWETVSVTLVYCGQMTGWLKMLLGMEVGLGPRDIVLDGNPALPHGKGHSSPPQLFSPSVVASGATCD